MHRKNCLKSQKASYIYELALLIPVALGFCLGLTECVNIARSYSAINEALNFGLRELVSVNGRGVKMSKPKSLTKYDWLQYNLKNNNLSYTKIASNTEVTPTQCRQVSNSNVGCVAKLSYLPSSNERTKRTIDFNSVIDRYIKKEIAVSALPDLKYNCKNKAGCSEIKYRLIPASNTEPEKIELEMSYNAPTPYLKYVLNVPYFRIVSRVTGTHQTDILERDPQIINENLDYNY
jgi:hypothetical protein